jgi:pyrophosphatase PpaX
MNKVRAIIFDISGTLLNDIHVVWKANAEAYNAFGIYGCDTLEEFRKRFKLPIQEFHRINGVPDQLMWDVDRKFREAYPKYSHRVAIFPEVVGALEELRRRRLSLGVASNIPSNFLREHLAQFSIAQYFDAVVGQEDCDEQKPSPKPILTALARLGARPEEAMYVCDMEEDLIAAKAAGTLATAIARAESYHPRWRLERHNPDYVITDLVELLRIQSDSALVG